MDAPVLIHVAGLPELAAARVVRDASGTDQPVIGVDFAFLTITDKNIAALPEDWQSLEYLVLTGTAITDESTPYLLRMSRLKDLGLGSTLITDSGCKDLGKLTSLEVLALANTGVTDAGLTYLTGLTNLQSLDLRGTAITDDGLQALSELRSLKSLCLCDTQVTAEGVALLKQRSPGLKCYWLTDDG